MIGLSKVTIYLIILGAIAASYGGTYLKGRSDGKAAYKTKIDREIAKATRNGNDAAAKALRDFDALPDGELPDDGFRRE